MGSMLDLKEYDMIKLKTLLSEQADTTPAVSGIAIMQNKLTSQNQITVNVDGVLSVVNCESPTGTYVVGSKKYDMALVQQALGTDTTIRVFSMNEGDTALAVVGESQPLKDMKIRFEFPIAKIPNLTADTTFYVMAMKAGKAIKFNDKPLRVQCEGFMLV
jgi:hypothetical protein